MMTLKVEYSFRTYRYDHYEDSGVNRIKVDIEERDIPASIFSVFNGEKGEVLAEDVLTLVRRLAKIYPWRDFNYFVDESPDGVFIETKNHCIAIGGRYMGYYLEIIAA